MRGLLSAEVARRPGDWFSQAACTDNPDLFFPDSYRKNSPQMRRQIREAVQICHSCPVKDPCLRFALANNYFEGVWGGTIPAERSALKFPQGWCFHHGPEARRQLPGGKWICGRCHSARQRKPPPGAPPYPAGECSKGHLWADSGSRWPSGRPYCTRCYEAQKATMAAARAAKRLNPPECPQHLGAERVGRFQRCAECVAAEKKKAARVCPKHPESPRKGPRQICEACSEFSAAKRKARAKRAYHARKVAALAEGSCYNCKRALEPSQPTPGGSLVCPHCQAAKRRSNQKGKALRHAEVRAELIARPVLCPDCAAPKELSALDGKIHCFSCVAHRRGPRDDRAFPPDLGSPKAGKN